MENSSEDSDTDGSCSSSIWIYRHANRLDEEDPNWIFDQEYTFDPPLSNAGIDTANRMGQFIWNNEKEKLLGLDDLSGLKLFSSPFQRCLQTSYHIATVLEKNWSIVKEKDQKNQIKICIEFGLAEDIPDRSVCNPYELIEQKDIILNYLDPNTDIDILHRIDAEHKSIYKPNSRSTHETDEEYQRRVSHIYNYLMNTGHHTILISSHLDETHVAYHKIMKIDLPIRHKYGIMANIIKDANQTKGPNMWSIRHHLWEHHERIKQKME